MAQHEPIQWRCHAKVDKYDADQTEWVKNRLGLLEPKGADFDTFGLVPETLEQDGNLLTTVGLDRLTGQLLSNTQVWDNTHTGLAVGDSATAEVIGDTDLNAVTNKYYMTMDATYPQQSNGVITVKATYASGVANFAWNEYGVIVPNSATTVTAGATLTGMGTSFKLLNHKTATLGTKASGSSWVFSVTITIS